METVLLRRRAAAKLSGLPGTHDWLFTDEALQQASAAPVALHRSERLRGNMIHDVTCSIGTELAALRGSAARVVGSDVDAVRLAMARHNLGDAVDLCRADALRPVTRDTVVLADPARRSGGRRRFNPRDYQPALDELIEAYRGRDLVVKCAPGIDFAGVTRLGFDGEIEVTSYRGSVREACLWSAGLAEAGVRRRASILDRGEQVTDAEQDDCPVRPAGRWIVDPDGAVVRAGLVRHYAARHGLWQLDPNIAYLSGDELPPGVRGFEVLEQLAFDERRLRQALGTLDCGVARDTGSRCEGGSRCVTPPTGAAWRPVIGRGHHANRFRCSSPGDGVRVPPVTLTTKHPTGLAQKIGKSPHELCRLRAADLYQRAGGSAPLQRSITGT